MARESLINLNADMNEDRNEDYDDVKEAFQYRAELARVILDS